MKNKNDKPYSDPLIDEVREVRRALSATFQNDVDKLCDYLQRIEEQHQERVVKPVQVISSPDCVSLIPETFTSSSPSLITTSHGLSIKFERAITIEQVHPSVCSASCGMHFVYLYMNQGVISILSV